MNKDRQCMFCQTPISECMGFVLARDILLVLEGKWDFQTMGWPREICAKHFACEEKWKEQLRQEDPEGDYSSI
jgi:hypothetical protein